MHQEYFKRLPTLKARLYAYQEKTKNLEIAWTPPVPVPIRQRSRAFDHFFSWGRPEVEDGVEAGLLVVFARNPNRRENLADPHGYMLISDSQNIASTVDDILAIFHTHIHEKEMHTVFGQLHMTNGVMHIEDGIQILKGVAPQSENELERKLAERFTCILNREIAILFLLATQAARAHGMLDTEIELARLSRLDFSN